jgi:hypothetical protein
MEENITSSKRKTSSIWKIVLVGFCLVLLLLCWQGLAMLRIIFSIPNPAPDPFPASDIVYGRISELGFINADGLDKGILTFLIEKKTLYSIWGRPLITKDSQTLIITDNNYPQVGNIYIAHPGKVAVDCKWWGIARLAPDQIHILVETKQGLEEYSPEDCGTGNAPKRVLSGVFGALSPDEQYSAQHRWRVNGNANESNIILREIKTGEERIVGEGIFPVWSPDGQWLAYTGPDGIYIVHNTLNSEPRRLVVLESPEPSINTPVYQYNPPEPYYPPIVSWSPDGQWLIYHFFNESLKTDAKYTFKPYSIFKVNVTTGDETKLLDGGLSPFWRWPAKP